MREISQALTVGETWASVANQGLITFGVIVVAFFGYKEAVKMSSRKRSGVEQVQDDIATPDEVRLSTPIPPPPPPNTQTATTAASNISTVIEEALQDSLQQLRSLRRKVHELEQEKQYLEQHGELSERTLGSRIRLLEAELEEARETVLKLRGELSNAEYERDDALTTVGRLQRSIERLKSQVQGLQDEERYESDKRA